MNIPRWLFDASPKVLVGLLFFGMVNLALRKTRLRGISNRWIVRYCILFPLSLLLGWLACWGIESWYQDYRVKHDRIERIETVTKVEADFLRRFAQKNKLKQCVFVPRTKGEIEALERDGIIFLISEDKRVNVRCYGIKRWAYLYLKKHPELIKPNT